MMTGILTDLSSRSVLSLRFVHTSIMGTATSGFSDHRLHDDRHID